MLIQCLLTVVLVFQACSAIPFGLQPRITDGENAQPNEFPYQVSVHGAFPPLLKYRHICGGSILNENYILTAAHCIMNVGKFKIFAGKHYLNKDEPTQQEIDVENVIVHKNYKGNIAPFDIAILKLKTSLVLNEKVSPVKLPKQNQVLVGDAVLTGWGSTSKRWRPLLPSVLQKATVHLLDNHICLKKFPDNIIGKPKIFDSQICTDSTGQVSACSGDSGGPLVQFRNGIPVQIGIVSWGAYPCGISSVPSVYTRVDYYIDWINNIIH